MTIEFNKSKKERSFHSTFREICLKIRELLLHPTAAWKLEVYVFLSANPLIKPCQHLNKTTSSALQPPYLFQGFNLDLYELDPPIMSEGTPQFLIRLPMEVFSLVMSHLFDNITIRVDTPSELSRIK